MPGITIEISTEFLKAMNDLRDSFHQAAEAMSDFNWHCTASRLATRFNIPIVEAEQLLRDMMRAIDGTPDEVIRFIDAGKNRITEIEMSS